MPFPSRRRTTFVAIPIFLECSRQPETQRRMGVAMTRGFQTRGGEMALGVMVSDLADQAINPELERF